MESFRRAQGRGSAALFYLGFCLVSLLVSGLIGGAARMLGDLTLQASLMLGNSTAVLICMVLGILVLQSKGNLDHFGYWCVVLMGAILAFFTNGLLGMVPIAFLTTRPPTPEKQWDIDEGDWQREEEVPLEKL